MPEGSGSPLPLHVNTETVGRFGPFPQHSRDSSLSSKNVLQIQTENLGHAHSPLTARFKSKTISDTPSTRTGPPRSLSYHFSVQHSPGPSRSNTYPENTEIYDHDQGTEFPFAFTSGESNFRGALELGNPEYDRKGKRKLQEGSWSPMKWFHESPKEEKANFDLGIEPGGGKATTEAVDDLDRGESGSKRLTLVPEESSLPQPKKGLLRTLSVPQSPGRAGWGRLRRSLFPNAVAQDTLSPATPSVVTSHSVNITDELITGGLSTLMLRLWFERDERGHRRVPVLFHRLRIRVSDSLHPLHAHKSVFRIECEYANGAARWVVYRQLRDFISLHTHYKFSNAYNHNVGKLPEFPRNST
jgi:phospholipase D1/2